MKQIQFQLFTINSQLFFPWIFDISNLKVGDIITIQNDKKKINGYTEKFSILLLGCLTNHNRFIMEYNDFVIFLNKICDLPKMTKKCFNSIPYFKFIIKNIDNDIVTIDPIKI